MDREIVQTEEKESEPQEGRWRRGPAHLMCSASVWGIAGFLGCAYFAWISYGHVRRSDYEWPHDLWTAGTYLVWIVLLSGLALDTRCLRERIFFGVLLLNFMVGATLTFWSAAAPAEIHSARLLTGALWALAAVVSLTTIGRSGKSD
jgi:hypothetical protein